MILSIHDFADHDMDRELLKSHRDYFEEYFSSEFINGQGTEEMLANLNNFENSMLSHYLHNLV
jgi:hypothetical protein